MPNDIDKLIAKIISSKSKKILLLGGPDSGKTTFGLRLAEEIAGKESATFTDTDIGQSVIGPPTTVGSIDVKKGENNITGLKPARLYFVGDVTPVKFLLPVIAGSFKLSSVSSHRQIIDTSGLVSYPFGHLLKFNKVMALNPDLIVCFRQKNELESLINFFKPYFNLEIVSVSKDLPKRSPLQRTQIRQKRFAGYFKDANNLLLDLDRLSVYPSERYIDNKNRGLTIGLNGSNDTLGIGLLNDVRDRKIEVITPVKEEVKGIVIGNLMLAKDGQALGRIR